jgi:hypothetical protein
MNCCGVSKQNQRWIIINERKEISGCADYYAGLSAKGGRPDHISPVRLQSTYLTQ